MSTNTISVAMGEEFTISLSSIATAGYLWKIESLPSAIEFLRTENEKPEADTKPGNATNQIFRFRAKEAGKYSITFEMARPWENKAIELRTITVDVV